jgi:hypothetical protein
MAAGKPPAVTADDPLMTMPLIPPAALGRELNVGLGAINGAARRVQVRYQRHLNGRDYLSVIDALAIHRDLSQRLLRRRAG